MIALLLVWLGWSACSGPEAPPGSSSPPASTHILDTLNFRYDLENPDQVLEMPGRLTEISGLSLDPSGEFLLAVQDEAGIIFWINKTTGEIENEIEFWKEGDYEGVEAANGDIYVVKSSGTIYQVIRPGTPQQVVEKYNFFLNEDNDIEGLCLDQAHNRLLLSCKAKAGEGSDFRFKKAIYAFDLDKKSLLPSPVFMVSLEDIQNYLQTDPMIRSLEKLAEFFDPNKTEFTFAPSAIAIHPFTADLYLLSNAGTLLLVLNAEGKIIHIEKMKKKIHPQPEGICFAPDGTMYISNEGDGEKGKIYRFDMK